MTVVSGQACVHLDYFTGYLLPPTSIGTRYLVTLPTKAPTVALNLREISLRNPKAKQQK